MQTVWLGWKSSNKQWDKYEKSVSWRSLRAWGAIPFTITFSKEADEEKIWLEGHDYLTIISSLSSIYRGS